jgi:hypothetical protein
MHTASLLLTIAAAYALAGVLFALPFVTFGITRVDPAARGSRWTFRLLVCAGVAALWPVMAAKWARVRRAAPDGHAAGRTR